MSSTIPLTTVFTPSPTCSTDYIIFTGDTRSTIRLAWAYTFLITPSPPSPTTSPSTNSFCEPPSISSVLRHTRQSAFSPGICPSGFTTATSSYISGTMHAYCCLSGYSVEDSLDKRYFQEEASLDLLQCRRYITTTVGGIKVASPAAGSSRVLVIVETTRMAPPVVVEHDALSVAWRLQELTAFEAATPTMNMGNVEESLAAESFGLEGSEIATSAIGATGTVRTSSAPASTESAVGDNGGSNGLSNGAKIGIGLGAGIGGAALLIVGLFLILRRKKANAYENESLQGIERDGVNQMGGIDDTPYETGGIGDSKS
ncbi:hypothetical protein ABW20_dc0101835 [Dactylellina cionopaga]|nr:hypothetical protein ABW20_dc0101835 [Dactylellina cionopaga]